MYTVWDMMPAFFSIYQYKTLPYDGPYRLNYSLLKKY